MRLKDFFFSNLLRGDCGEEGCITGAWKTGIRKGHDFGEDVGVIQKVVPQMTMAWIPEWLTTHNSGVYPMVL